MEWGGGRGEIEIKVLKIWKRCFKNVEILSSEIDVFGVSVRRFVGVEVCGCRSVVVGFSCAYC